MSMLFLPKGYCLEPAPSSFKFDTVVLAFLPFLLQLLYGIKSERPRAPPTVSTGTVMALRARILSKLEAKGKGYIKPVNPELN